MTVAFLIAALVCFIIAAIIGFASPTAVAYRFGWGWLGAAFITIIMLINAAQGGLI